MLEDRQMTQEQTEPELSKYEPLKPIRYVEWQTWPFDQDQPQVSSHGISEWMEFEDIREVFEFYGHNISFRDISVDL